MSDAHVLVTQNRLLAALPAATLQLLIPHFEWVDLVLNTTLYEVYQTEEYAYFPLSGICSVIAENLSGVQIDTGLIGKDGFVGIPIILFADRTPSRIIILAEGRAMRISRESLLAVFNQNQALRIALLRYAHVFSVQISQTALANGSFNINQRLARWLLMCQDRIDGREFPMTHRFLAEMLAVRRAGITEALNYLEGRNAIKALRGRIIILNRSQLEDVADGAYGMPEQEYKRLLASWSPMSNAQAEQFDA